ncbi:MAG: peptidoglycan DD-metalloendopeptidase family protein [Flavobacteriales bacterium]
MLNLQRTYLLCAIIVLGFTSKVNSQSAIELMADTAAWENYEAHIGGPTAEEEEEAALFSEESRDLGLWTLADSIAKIPAYDTYCDWDTKNLFVKKDGAESLVEPIDFILCHDACDFVYPANGIITSSFGPRWGRMHSGLDIDLETGDPVSAAFEGMVRISQYSSSYGNVVVIRHSNGLETLYAHLSQRTVVPGDYVQAGDQIGLGGNTGRSYGSHLHFEVRYKGDAIDPSLLLDPNGKNLRDWEFTLNKAHFSYANADQFTKTALSARGGNSKFHVVKRGETLSAIARKRGTSVQKLCKLNKLRESSIIREGQKLRYK